jgi:hypothetical protein
MANGKWVLHYAALNIMQDFEVLEFASKRKRLYALSDKINGVEDRVFLLAIDEPNGDGSSKYFQIYIFEKWQNMFVDIRNGSPFFSNPQYEIYLQEYSSYQEAYQAALNMRISNKFYKNSTLKTHGTTDGG